MIERLPDPARSRAVLIGTSAYADPEFTALPGVANNLDDLADVLTSPHGTGLRPENCVVLHNPPSQVEVGAEIVRAASEAEDVLLVYYAGHGQMTWDGTNELCLTVRDTSAAALRTSALRCADLRHYLRGSGADTTVLILDCCFAAEALADTMSGAANAVLGQVEVAGSYVLAAASDRALAPSGLRNTLFTSQLLALLRTGVASAAGMLLTLDTLFRGIKSTMRQEGWPEPSSNNNGSAGWLALAPNPAHRTRRALTALEARVDVLAEAEARTRLAYETALDKITEPNLQPCVAAAPDLRDRLAGLLHRAMAGRLPTVAELDRVDADLTEAEDVAARLREVAEGLVDRRDELRQLLANYQVMASRLAIAEDPELVFRYERAKDLLWVRPCDLGASSRAVDAYLHAVTDRRGRSR